MLFIAKVVQRALNMIFIRKMFTVYVLMRCS